MNRMGAFLLFFAMGAALSWDAKALDSLQWENEFEAGYQYSRLFRRHDASVTELRSLPYFLQKTDGNGLLLDRTFKPHISLRVQHDFADPRVKVLDVRAFNAEMLGDNWKLIVGMQEIGWGETFGVFVLDVVNPRDLRDPLFNEIGWNRLAVPAVNGFWYWGSLTLQGIVNPLARESIHPDSGSPFNSYAAAQRSFATGENESMQFGRDSEYGARAGYLTDFGLDLNLYYYNHYNRNLVYELKGPLSSLTLMPVRTRVPSYGMSFSYATQEWVFRGDTVSHDRYPTANSNLRGYKTDQSAQTVLGVDYNADSGLGLGLQYHWEDTDSKTSHAASFRTYYPVFNRKLEPELFLYKGLNSPDLWISPKLTAHVFETWSVALRLDFLAGDRGKGLIGPLKDRDRLFTWVSHSF